MSLPSAGEVFIFAVMGTGVCLGFALNMLLSVVFARWELKCRKWLEKKMFPDAGSL